jgi:hypothetical protein
VQGTPYTELILSTEAGEIRNRECEMTVSREDGEGLTRSGRGLICCNRKSLQYATLDGVESTMFKFENDIGREQYKTGGIVLFCEVCHKDCRIT